MAIKTIPFNEPQPETILTLEEDFEEINNSINILDRLYIPPDILTTEAITDTALLNYQRSILSDTANMFNITLEEEYNYNALSQGVLYNITVEEERSILKKLLDKVIMVVNKVVTGLKKTWTKLVIVFSRLEAKAKELLREIENKDFSNIKLTNDETSKINKLESIKTKNNSNLSVKEVTTILDKGIVPFNNIDNATNAIFPTSVANIVKSNKKITEYLKGSEGVFLMYSYGIGDYLKVGVFKVIATDKPLDVTGKYFTVKDDKLILKTSYGSYNKDSVIKYLKRVVALNEIAKREFKNYGSDLDNIKIWFKSQINKYKDNVVKEKSTNKLRGESYKGSMVSSSKLDIIKKNFSPVTFVCSKVLLDRLQGAIKQGKANLIISEMIINKAKDK